MMTHLQEMLTAVRTGDRRLRYKNSHWLSNGIEVTCIDPATGQVGVLTIRPATPEEAAKAWTPENLDPEPTVEDYRPHELHPSAGLGVEPVHAACGAAHNEGTLCPMTPREQARIQEHYSRGR